ncbi:hypothetical protein Adt_39507 [Abeliophyllum distichum]|uniref:Uncharacterized protein n=1 Tax=Abeliophyllum distichum TaxID=126358 RepID=A0ABD1Q9H4_9LAMI
MSSYRNNCIFREDSGSKVDFEEVQENTNKIDQLDDPIVELASDENIDWKKENHQFPRIRQLCVSEQGHSFSSEIRSPITSNVLPIEKDEPTTYVELKSSVDSKRWQKTIEFEMSSMYENKGLDLD